MTGVKPYVLRFWETEFVQIQPLLTEGGQKMYRPDDLLMVEKIKILLFDEKMSIPQAKAFLDREELDEDDYLEEEVTEEVVEEIVVAEASVEEKSIELKKALEDIIQAKPQAQLQSEASDQVESKAYTGVVKSESDYKLLNSDKITEEKLQEEEQVKIVEKVVIKEVFSAKTFDEKEVLNIIQAKKKLSSVLGKINNIIEERNW